jgi:hypothetical protein
VLPIGYGTFELERDSSTAAFVKLRPSLRMTGLRESISTVSFMVALAIRANVCRLIPPFT